MSDGMSRKDFFRRGLKSLFTGEKKDPKKNAPSTPPPTKGPVKLPVFVRPPGAVQEDRFLELCDGCSQCVEACHQDSIFLLPEAVGAPLAKTPAIFSQVRPCFLCTDVPCSNVCPTGAIEEVAVQDIRIGTAVVDTQTCVVTHGQACDQCLTACPLPGQALLVLPSLPVPLIDPIHCTGCGLCVPACPTRPSSITVYPTFNVQQ